MSTKKLMLAGLSAVALGFGIPAMAAQVVSSGRDRMPMSPGMAAPSVDVPMTRAIRKVENETGDRAVMAQLTSAPDGPAYLIAVVNPGGRGVTDFRVDADTGMITDEPAPMRIKMMGMHDSGF